MTDARAWRGRLARTGGLMVVALVFAVPTALASFFNAQAETMIGAHHATVAPTTSGHAHVMGGPLLPELRIDLGTPFGLGVDITLLGSETSDFEEILALNAAIASQPEGEIARVRSIITGMVTDAAIHGLAAGAIAVVAVAAAWRLVGARRRRELVRAWPPGRTQWAIIVAGSLVVGSAAWVMWPHGDDERAVAWVPILEEFPELPRVEALENVSISRGAATSGGRAILDGAINTYSESVEFYSVLAESAADIEVREPGEGEVTALVVTDRHDNIGMDPVARAVGDVAGISFVIDLGDDTSNGASWETFSINSLRTAFDDVPIIAVAGNHDQGTHIVEEMRQQGFEMLEGERHEIEGIGFLGESDPRSSGLTSGYHGDEADNSAAMREQDARLADVACSDNDVDDDGQRPISVIAVHSSASARTAADRGCVDLVLSGHLHRQVGPTIIDGELGRTVTLTTASTGGAIYAFSLGTKLRRDAQVTIVTFRESRAVGLQIVEFQPGGIIVVGDYTPVGPDLPPPPPTIPDDGGQPAAGEAD